MKSDDNVRFVNRSRDDYHEILLRILDEKGPSPTATPPIGGQTPKIQERNDYKECFR